MLVFFKEESVTGYLNYLITCIQKQNTYQPTATYVAHSLVNKVSYHAFFFVLQQTRPAKVHLMKTTIRNKST